MTVNTKALRELLATEGPAEWEDNHGVVSVDMPENPSIGHFTENSRAELACAAVNALPALLDEVEALRDIRDKRTEECSRWFKEVEELRAFKESPVHAQQRRLDVMWQELVRERDALREVARTATVYVEFDDASDKTALLKPSPSGRMCAVGDTKNWTLALCAYIVREAAGLDDMEPVTLTVGATAVRVMALNARKERSALREVAKAVSELEHDPGCGGYDECICRLAGADEALAKWKDVRGE